jgi:hypothetical protein
MKDVKDALIQSTTADQSRMKELEKDLAKALANRTSPTLSGLMNSGSSRERRIDPD